MKRSFLILSTILVYGFNVSAQNKADTTKKSTDTLVYDKTKLPIFKRDAVDLDTQNKSSETESKSKKSAKSNVITSSEDVGKSPISVDVSPTGAGLFSMPIVVPTGIAGFTPEIALAYNSQSGMGSVGYGWNISGLSSISRIPSTKYHNGKIREVRLDKQDQYALDGQRLLIKSGTYGQDGAEYQTEAYSNVRIFSRGSLGSDFGPESFEVLYPDGSKAFYGLTADTRTLTEYAISYRQNAIGARINYTYNAINNKILYIVDVDYGIIGAGNGVNKIHFSYEAALRGEHAFIAGVGFYRDQLINKISVSVNGTAIRNYKLDYSNLCAINYQKLELITEYNGDESRSFVPMYLSYSNGGSEVDYVKTTTLSLSGITNTNSSTLFADLTGDGTTDIIVYPTAKNKFYGFLDMEPNTPYQQHGYEVNTGHFKEIFPVTWLTHNSKVLSGQGLAVVKDQGTSYKFEILTTGITSPFSFQYDRVWNNVPTAPTFYSACANEYKTLPLDMHLLSGDFNGDGLTDIIAINDANVLAAESPQDPSDPYYNPGNCDLGYGDIGSSAYFINLDRRITSDFVTNLGMLTQSYHYGDKLYTGDFNGDGKTDILHVRAGNMFVYTISEHNTLQLLWQTQDSRITNNFPPLMGDYNGDGKQDIMFPTGSGNSWYNNPGNYLYATFLSYGDGFVKHEQVYPFNSNWGTSGSNDSNGNPIENRFYLIPTDINGDGKTDIVYSIVSVIGNTGSGRFRFIAYNNMGSTTSGNPIFEKGLESERVTVLRKDAIPVVLQNDAINTNLEVGILSNNTLSTYEFSHSERSSVLTRVWQNLVSYHFEYEKLMSTTNTGIYSTQFSQTFPTVDFQNAPNMWVVKKMKRWFGTDQILQQTFSYADAISNTEGLGFLGFGRLTRSNWHQEFGDTQIMYNTSITNPLLRGAVIKSFVSRSPWLNTAVTNSNAAEPHLVLTTPVTTSKTEEASKSITLSPGFTANGANGVFIAKLTDPVSGVDDGASASDYISRTDYTYQTQTLANKVFINVPISVATKDLLNGTNTLQTNEYDAYYNVTKSSSNFSGAGSKTEEITYENNPAGYYIGRPLTKKTTASSAGDTHTSEEQYTYTGSLPTQIKRKGYNTAWITETMQYDTFGNVTQKIVSTSTGSRQSSTTYDATGRFALSNTDVEGMQATATYDPVMGSLLTSTNPFAQTSSFQYDTWGRQTEATDYLGKKSYKTYASDGEGGVIITATNDEGQETKSYTNALGQNTQTRSKDVLGNTIGKSTKYDIYGRISKESQPAGPNNYNQWNESEYDEYGRLKSSTSYTGKVTNITYNGLSTTVNDGTKAVTTVKNALGQVSSVQDPGGTINYSYFANGNLKTADFGGSVQTLQYDGWGRKIKLIDPSAGQYTYTYNDFGEITQEITPKGTTNLVYGTTGQLNSKAISGDHTSLSYTYTYNTASKLLTGVAFTNADGNNATYTYTYDGLYRPSGTTENNTYAKFEKTFSYDAFGRVSTETAKATNKRNSKEASRTIAFTYQNGELLQSTDQASGQILSKISSLNNKGLLVTEQQGANLHTNYSYDTFNLPQTTVLTKSGAPSPLISLAYNFDAQRGNLTSRSNSAFSWNESFTYDNLDRLKSITDNSGNQSQDYDNRGRITYNSQLGNYSYSGAGYQQTELNNPTAAATTWYQSHSKQQISFNALKQPVNITELGHAQIDFQYNGAGERSHMYYGSNDADKMARPNRRHYSEDGSMEITEDLVGNTTSFVFFLDGDAYSAPAIYKETANQQTNQTTGQLYYLHRDHLGSVVMITNQTGDVVEKRAFDAWGNILALTDGAGNTLAAFGIIDRGYTGHEHLLSVGLVHMNARLYDPKLHRFIQADDYVKDPYNSQNYNRYGYGQNNPLIYSDPSGNVHFLIPILIGAAIGAASGGAAYLGTAMRTGEWNWGRFGMSMLGGAVIGGITGGLGGSMSSFTSSAFGNAVLNGFASGLIPSANMQIGNFNFSISASLAFGSSFGIGANLGVGYSNGNWNISAGLGVMSYGNYHGMGSGEQIRASLAAGYDNGKNGFSLGTNSWSGTGSMETFKQRTGAIGLHFGNFRALYENDGGFGIKNARLGDRGDSYRTAALNVSYKDFTAGFNLFTGKRDLDYEKANGMSDANGKFSPVDGVTSKGRAYPRGFVHEVGLPYRLGALTIGYKNYRFGTNSEHVRHAIQDKAIHGLIKDGGFQNQSWNWQLYSGYSTRNNYSSW